MTILVLYFMLFSSTEFLNLTLIMAGTRETVTPPLTVGGWSTFLKEANQGTFHMC